MVELALNTKLTRARRYWAVLEALEGVGWVLFALALAALLCFHVDRALALSPGMRLGILWTGGLLALLALGSWVAWPLLRRRSDEMVAIRVERRYPDFRERLLSTVEFGHRGAVPGTSASMVEALAGETATMAQSLRFESAFSPRGMMRSGVLLALMLAAWTLQVALAPQAVGAWWERMAHPAAGVAVFRDTRVHISPLDRRMLRGGSLDVTVTADGRPVRDATLYFRFGDGPWSHVRLTGGSPVGQKGLATEGTEGTEKGAEKTENETGSPALGGPPLSALSVPLSVASVAAVAEPSPSKSKARNPKFGYRFEALTESVTYYATAGDGRSDPGRAEVVDPPSLVGMTLRYRYPAYMGRRDDTYHGTSGSVLAPVGTRVQVALTANKPLTAARMLWATGAGGSSAWRDAGGWPVQAEHATGDLVVRSSGRYGLRLWDTDRFESAHVQEFPVQAIPDRAPEVQLTRPGGDRELVSDGSLTLEGLARDDYGVDLARLWYQVDRGAAGTLPLARGGRQQRAVEVASRWNLAALQLKPGDVVRYRLEATDYDNITGPHVGKSSEYRVRILDRSEMERRLAEQREALQQMLQQMIQEQKATRAAVEQARQAGQRDTSAAEQRQRSLGQQATEASQRLSDLRQALESNAMASAQELQQQQQSQQGLSQLGQQAMPQAADRIAAAQRAQSPQQAQQNLGQASQQQQEIGRQLEEIRRALRGQDDLGRLADQADRLAQAQRELQQQTGQMMPKTLGQTRQDLTQEQRSALDRMARAQNAARQATQQLEQRLGQAARSLRANDPSASQAAQQAGQQMQQQGLPERQAEAEQQLSQNALASAAQQQQRVAQDLQQLANQLRSAQRGGAQTPEERQRQALMQHLERLQQMLENQREVMRLTRKNADAKQTPRLSRRESALQQQAQRMAQSLQRQSANQNQSMRSSSSRAASRMQRAARSMSRSAMSLSREQPRESLSSQQQAEQDMEEAMQDLQRAMAESDADRQREELRQRLAELAGQQKAIHDATNQADAQRHQSPNSDAAPRELERLAGRQGEVDKSAQGLQPQMPSKVFKDAMTEARSAMQRSQKGLQQRDSGPDTRDAQQRAAGILDRMARALDDGDSQDDQQAGGGGGNGGGQQRASGNGQEDEELRQRLSDLKLLRGTEQAIREQTQELERQRASGKPLTPEQEQRLRELAQRQRAAHEMTEEAARGLRRFPRLSQRVGEAGEDMGHAEQGLGQNQTGQPTQEAEGQAVLKLSDALRQMEQMAQQRRQGQRMAQRPGQQQGRNRQNGNRPAVESLDRHGNGQGGRLDLVGPGPRGFGPLTPRDQAALRQGWRERIPTDYADLVNRYYKALSERGR